MKYFKILSFFVLCIAVISCNKGADSIDKAFEQASNKATGIDVAKTLSQGDVDCKTLTIDEFAKLGACLNYINANETDTAKLYNEVDSTNYKKLVSDFNFTLRTDNSEKVRKIKELTVKLSAKNSLK